MGYKKCTDFSYIFSDCYNLISLPDISKWKTNNCISMKRLFSNCCSLTSLPDISNWKINNVTDISGILIIVNL